MDDDDDEERVLVCDEEVWNKYSMILLLMKTLTENWLQISKKEEKRWRECGNNFSIRGAGTSRSNYIIKMLSREN